MRETAHQYIVARLLQTGQCINTSKVVHVCVKPDIVAALGINYFQYDGQGRDIAKLSGTNFSALTIPPDTYIVYRYKR